MFSSIVSVAGFVDYFINAYTEYEKINKINIYFTIKDIIRDTKYSNSLIIRPQFIHIDYEEGEVLDPGVYANYDKIVEHFDYDNGFFIEDLKRELFIRVRENKNRSMKIIKENHIYKLVIDCSELKEFINKENKKIKYYDSSFMAANDNEIDEHKSSGSYKKYDVNGIL